MAPRKSRSSTPEFPILSANGLYAGEIRGDGNCLFNALSDQLYGNQEMHEVLRTATIEHMRVNADFYRQYMTVNPVRRNPKRKTTAASAARIDTTSYSEAELQRQFEAHVEKMGQPGEWADNMEVSAFASALGVDVRLWQGDYTYLISPRDTHDIPAEKTRQTLNIAYHSWEHYSSVRNVHGPHTGPPEVTFDEGNLVKSKSKKRPSPSVDGDDDEGIPRTRKRRSPLPLFDSDSTPEGTESSSDESNGPVSSQQRLDLAESEPPLKPVKLTIKLRGLRTTDPIEPLQPIRAVTPTTSTSMIPSPKTTTVTTAAITSPTTPLRPIPSPITTPITAVPFAAKFAEQAAAVQYAAEPKPTIPEPATPNSAVPETVLPNVETAQPSPEPVVATTITVAPATSATTTTSDILY